jgi:O-acetyl-ADP-ribose deacetylase (regulator of RNase III)
MESIDYVKGDLIKLADDGEFDMIVHGCNCFATMAAGIAYPIGRRWPEAKKIDALTKRGDVHKLGSYTVVDVKTKSGANLKVMNAYTQYKPGPDFKLVHLESVLFRIREKFPDLHIGIPLIGCGIGGGDWSEVEKMINTEFNDLYITVVIYEQD